MVRRVVPSAHPVLMAIPTNTTASELEIIRQALFQKVKVPAVCFADSAMLALLSLGKKTGVVVDCGCSQTTITPVWEGEPIKKAIYKFPMSGEHISNFSNHLSAKYGKAFHAQLDKFAKELLESVEIHQELKQHPDISPEDKLQMLLPYYMFSPSELTSADMHIFGLKEEWEDKKGLVRCTYEAILACEPSQQLALFNQIVIIGGISKLKGFSKRFHNVMSDLCPSQTFHIHSPPHPTKCIIQGAKIYANLPTFRNNCEWNPHTL